MAKVTPNFKNRWRYPF